MNEIEEIKQNLLVRDFVCHICITLNNSNWEEFIKQCNLTDFNYSIENFSPEIKKRQYWMRQNFEGIKHLLLLLPKHNSDHAQLTRHITPYSVKKISDSPEIFEAISQLVIYRTEWDSDNSHLKSGATSLYVIGKYVDKIIFNNGAPFLLSRIVDLDTRQVGTGSHMVL
jgi:methanesulfonate monooxygenase small subunit